MGGVAVITKNGGVDVITSQKVISTIPTGWDEQIAEYGRGYNYPKPTGQTTVFRTGDDADIEATIFAPVRVANSLKVQNSKTDFFTLGNANSFGNTNVFTDINGLQVYGDDLVIDNDSGLMIYRIVQGANSKNWEEAIDESLASLQGGFDGWFLFNTNQIISICNYGIASGSLLNYAPFNIAANLKLSNTVPNNTTRAPFNSNNAQLANPIEAKTTNRSYIICRKHF
jgi:hypothetical protein